MPVTEEDQVPSFSNVDNSTTNNYRYRAPKQSALPDYQAAQLASGPRSTASSLRSSPASGRAKPTTPEPSYGGFGSAFERDLAVRERGMAQGAAMDSGTASPARKAAMLRVAALEFKAKAAGTMQDPATRQAIDLARKAAEDRNIGDKERNVYTAASGAETGALPAPDVAAEIASGGGGGGAPQYEQGLRGYADAPIGGDAVDRGDVFTQSFWQQPKVQDQLKGFE